VSEQRHLTVPRPRTIAADAPKSVELEQRISRLELVIREMQTTLDLRKNRISELERQVDYLASKVRPI